MQKILWIDIEPEGSDDDEIGFDVGVDLLLVEVKEIDVGEESSESAEGRDCDIRIGEIDLDDEATGSRTVLAVFSALFDFDLALPFTAWS